MLKYRLKNALLLSLLILALIGSCSKENASSSKVSLTSFGPSGVAHGETIKFIGTNLNQVTSIVLPVDVEVPASSFTTQTPTLIELVVPDASTVGYVTLKTPQGDVVSKTAFGSSYIMSVASFTPTTAKPGTNITITGNFLNYVRQVTFSDKQKVTQFVSQSLNQLVVQVPMTAQTGGISLTDLAKTPSVVDKDDKGNALILIVNLPSVSSLSPSSIEQTKNLTIAGTDLDLVNEIDLAGGTSGIKIAPPFVSQSATQIVVTVPNTTISGTLTLIAISGVKTVTTQTLTVLEPKATSLAPQPAKPGTDNITITGTDLNLVASLTLYGVAQAIPSSAFVSQSPTEIVLLLPQSATAGGVNYTTIHGYSDKLGVSVTLPVPGPPTLPIVLYDDQVAGGGGDWSWGKVISDPASTDYFYSGNVSWKFEGTGNGGLSAGGITATDASGQQAFVFSLYGGPGTDGHTVNAVLNDNWPDANTVTLAEGKWTEYKISLSKFPTTDITKIVRFAFQDGSSSTSFFYADRVGFGSAACVTNFPAGQLLYSFDSSVQGWGGGTYQAPAGLVTSFAASEGHSCSGAAQLMIPFASYGQSADIEINPNPAMDFTGKSKLHFWAKVQVAGGATAAITAVQFYVNTGGYSKYSGTGYINFTKTLSDGGSFSDGNWHEGVYDIAGNTANIVIGVINQFGVQVITQSSAPGGGPALPPTVTLIVDDVWVE